MPPEFAPVVAWPPRDRHDAVVTTPTIATIVSAAADPPPVVPPRRALQPLVDGSPTKSKQFLASPSKPS
eukprot:2052050-Prymnesium_polylepis.1